MRLTVNLLYFTGEHFQPGPNTKICSLHFQPKDFYNFWSSYRTLQGDVVPYIFPFDKSKHAKSRTLRNSNKEQIVTEDYTSVSASAAEEEMDHCTLEGDRINQQHSDCYQIIHKLEETISFLQDQVKGM